jgi:hypothetical protein
MMKVLCERPRRSGWSPDKKGIVGVFRRAKASADEDFDDYLPTKIGMRAPAVNKGHKGGKTTRLSRKELNENLNPLWRFLKKNCGRPWSEVYSEMREVCDARSAIGYHIFQHALDSWGNGWVHDFGLTRENYHVSYMSGFWGGERTLSHSNKIGIGDFVVENGILYGPPNSQGISVPKKLRDLIRTDNIRKHKQSKKSIRRHDAPTTCEEIAKADEVLWEKKQRNKVEKKRKRDYKRWAKVFEMSEEEFQKELSKMSERSRLEFVK